jgi:hypothetical protein
MATQPLAYDSVYYAVHSARVKMGDRLETIVPITGKVFELTDAFMQQCANVGWRRLQDELATLGYQKLNQEILVQGLPPVVSQDPAQFTYLNGTGYWDTVTLWPSFALPATFTHPLKIWERWSNINAQFVDPPMEKMLSGLPTQIKTTSIRRWEWRNDTIWMPGSQMVEDLRIRFVQFMPDFVDSGMLRWYQQPLPIMRCSEALSWMICGAIENGYPKGNAAKAMEYFQQGKAAAFEIFNRDTSADIHVNIRRRPRTGRVGDYYC